jgi:flagellar biosynthesis/type III secretory pathway chaperone
VSEMSTENLISTMEKLLKLHQSLYELSTKKTDIVKQGDMDALNQIIKVEQAHISAINKLENERQTVAEALLPGVDNPSISDCLEVLGGTDKETLNRFRTELLEVVAQIKEKNELNQQMIYQSLQFVNLSLHLFAPQPEDFNYGPPAGGTSATVITPGLFNTKA